MEGAPALHLPFFLHDPPPADITLLTVKVYDTPSALHWLPALGGDRQPTAVVQNGVHRGSLPFLPSLSWPMSTSKPKTECIAPLRPLGRT
jgi:Ketopantoate reductase PanE/ApbA